MGEMKSPRPTHCAECGVKFEPGQRVVARVQEVNVIQVAQPRPELMLAWVHEVCPLVESQEGGNAGEPDTQF